MQRQRGDLVPIGEVIGDLGGPVQAIRDTSPQALHHFNKRFPRTRGDRPWTDEDVIWDRLVPPHTRG